MPHWHFQCPCHLQVYRQRYYTCSPTIPCMLSTVYGCLLLWKALSVNRSLSTALFSAHVLNSCALLLILIVLSFFNYIVVVGGLFYLILSILEWHWYFQKATNIYRTLFVTVFITKHLRSDRSILFFPRSEICEFRHRKSAWKTPILNYASQN